MKKMFERPGGGKKLMNQSFLNPDPTFERLLIVLPQARCSKKIPDCGLVKFL